MNQTMKLKKLEIEFQLWGPQKGHYTGEIEYEGQEGAVKMTLSPEVSLVLLKACGDNILALSEVSAKNLRDSIQSSIAEAKAGPAIATLTS